MGNVRVRTQPGFSLKSPTKSSVASKAAAAPVKELRLGRLSSRAGPLDRLLGELARVV